MSTCCHRSADHCAIGVKITGSHCCPKCAHELPLTPTEAEWHALWDAMEDGKNFIDRHASVVRTVAAIIAARLAPIRVLADEWAGWAETRSSPRIDAFRDAAEALRAALDAPVSASQDHDGAEGHANDCGTHNGLVWCHACEDKRQAEHWADEWKKAPNE